MLSSPEMICRSGLIAQPSARISSPTSNNWGPSDMRFVRQALITAALGAIAIAASGLALRPPGKEETLRFSGPLLEGAQIDAETLGIVERSCQNCHSERTQWPWYS